MSEQVPSVGRIVHYVSYGSPIRPDGTQAFTSECRAAIVTEVVSESEGNLAQGAIEQWDPPALVKVGLCVTNPTGLFFHQGVQWSPNNTGGTWHWPERV